MNRDRSGEPLEAPAARGALAGRVTFAAQVLNQKDKVVIESDWEALMLREGPARARAAREKAGNTAGSGDKT